MNDVSRKTEGAAGGMRRMSLRWKVVGLTGASMVLLTVLLVVVFTSQARSVIRNEMRERGRMMAGGLAKNLAYATSAGDTVGLQIAADGMVRDTPDAIYVFFREPNGTVLASARHLDLRDKTAESLPAAQVDRGAGERELEVHGLRVLDVTVPIAQAEGQGKPLGLVQVGLRVDRLTGQISAITWRALLLALIALAGCTAAGYILARMLTTPLERLTAAAAGMAAGDLRQDVRAAGRDEIAALSTSFQSMAEGLRSMVAELGRVAEQVESEGREILGSVTRQSAMATEQAAAINETSATVAEIAQSSKQATEHADRVIQVAQRSEDLSLEGKKVVEDAVGAILSLAEQVKASAAAMNELAQRTRQIGDIIATVKELAEQSNLLALNAAIEASRAGEHGRGFSVVAMEMRNLAEQSKAAAGQVKSMLGEVDKGTRQAVSATEEGEKRARAAIELARGAGQTIEGLAETIRESSLAAKQIAANTRQQTIGVEQIVTAISQVSAAMTDAVEGSRRIEHGTGNLNALSQRMLEAVKRYRV